MIIEFTHSEEIIKLSKKLILKLYSSKNGRVNSIDKNHPLGEAEFYFNKKHEICFIANNLKFEAMSNVDIQQVLTVYQEIGAWDK